LVEWLQEPIEQEANQKFCLVFFPGYYGKIPAIWTLDRPKVAAGQVYTGHP
jgi:hypothetical protein